MMACDLCGSDKPRFVLQSRRLDGPVVRCPLCGLYYVGSRRSSLTFGSGSASDVVERVRQANEGFQNLRLEEEHRLGVLNAEWRLKIIRDVCASGRLLEVGCARGDFLAVAKAHFDVLGVEPNPDLASSAQRFAPIHRDVVETLDQRDFDVAVSFHVIEHVDSPRRFVAAMSERVRPGGIVVIETPNIAGFPFRLFSSRWRQFIPEHYYFFDPGTITRLMESNNLKVERILTVGKYASMELVLNRLSRYTALMSPLSGIARALGISRLTFRINPGDIMFVVARKSQ